MNGAQFSHATFRFSFPIQLSNTAFNMSIDGGRIGCLGQLVLDIGATD